MSLCRGMCKPRGASRDGAGGGRDQLL